VTVPNAEKIRPPAVADDLAAAVEAVLESEIRPALGAHAGSIKLTGIEDDVCD
jgi:Fe-S cluster biogenesis protein NfuA